MANILHNIDNFIDDFTFIIARKDFYKFGIVKADGVRYRHNFNSPDELSFRVHKTDDLSNDLWDRINDYNIVIVPELGDDGYFEIDVELSEDEEGVYKSITATSLAEAELSHVKIYNYEVNTEQEMLNDEEWSKDYHTIFYRRIEGYANDPEMYKKMKHTSLLHRLLDKVPNYRIEHVDSTLLEITDWYQFSWDNQDLYSILTGDVAEQYHVLFKFNSKNRSISVYDMYSVCQNDDCSYRLEMKKQRNITTRYRGDFHWACPYCGSKNITPGYGKFTKILVSKDNLSTSASVRSNKDSLINCFKIKSGDDLMDAAVVNQNPNGSNYIYQFSNENKKEMPAELVAKLEDYADEYDRYYYGDTDSGKGIYEFTYEEVSAYNELVNSLDGKFDADTLANFITLKNTYEGYQGLSSQFYSVLDLEAFYGYSMAPTVETNNDSLSETKVLLEQEGSLSPIAVVDPSRTTIPIIENGILQTAKCIINTSLYELTVNTTNYIAPSTNNVGIWNGTITIVSIEHKGTDKEQEYTVVTDPLAIQVNGDMATYVKQKVDKLIARKNAQILPLTKLVDLKPLTGLTDYTGIEDSQASKNQFKQQLKYYSLDILTNIVNPAFQDTMSIIVENSNKINEIFYDIYHSRLEFIQDEIVLRTQQLETIKKIKDKIVAYRDATKDALNFQSYLGDDLYNIFCAYRREDTYQNNNFISDNLDNTTIMKKAGDLIDFAQKELFKSSNLQYEVTGNLNNLLALPEFASIFDDFEVGNWIHMSVDDTIYNLRLLSYEISFDGIQDISVDFSTVEKIWSGASDIQSVLKSAGSIAGSYSNTQQQLNRVQDPAEKVRDWIENGLDATQTKFFDDSVTQEIVYDSSGFYARGYDEITETYYPQQLKINKNGIYLTDDNWEHLRTGIGAFTYFDPDPNVNGYVDSYGVIANTVVGKLFLGENLKIYNQSGSLKMTDDGFEVTNGVNTVRINPNDTKLFTISNSLRDVLSSDSSGNLSIVGDITANSLTLGPNASLDGYLQKDTPLGTLPVSGATTSNTTGFVVSSEGLLKASSAIIYGTIFANAGEIGGCSINNGVLKVTQANIDGTLTANNVVANIDITSPSISGGTISGSSIYIGTKDTTTNLYPFQVTSNGAMNATGATISGDITANTGHIGGTNGWVIKTGAIHTASHTGYNTANDGIYIGTDYIGLGNGGKVWFKNDGTFSLGNGSITYNGSSLSFASTVTVNWNNLPATVASTSQIPTDINQLNDARGQKLTQTNLTSVGNIWIATTDVYAENLQVKSANIQGTITADAVVANISLTSPSITGGTINIGTLDTETNTYPFQVDSNGKVTTTGVQMNTGYIGGKWYFDYDGIYNMADGHNGARFTPTSCIISAINNSISGVDAPTAAQAVGLTKAIINSATDTYSYSFINGPSYSLQLYSGTDVSITSSDKLLLNSKAASVCLGDSNNCFRPTEDGETSLGRSNYRWTTVYATNDTISTSDLKNKDVLGNIDYAEEFIMALNPVRYMWKNGNHRRVRMGFVAQDVARTCKDLNQNLAVVTASYKNDIAKDYLGEKVNDNELVWGLSYHELIAPMISVIQKQQKQINQLTNELNEIKKEIRRI